MSATAADKLAQHAGDDESGEPGRPAWASRGVPPGLVRERLVAVPWRHAGLIAACAVLGGLASGLWWPRAVPAPTRMAATRPHMQPIQDAPLPPLELRLELEPPASDVGAPGTLTAEATPPPAASLRLDDAREPDEIDAVLRQAPPAAGRMPRAVALRAATRENDRSLPTLPGLAAGLLLGLLAAAVRELGGQRMRSPREAEWALGAPVLGAIPTLSPRARDALLERPRKAPDPA